MKCVYKQIRITPSKWFSEPWMKGTQRLWGSEQPAAWPCFSWLSEERACAVADLSGQIPLPGLWVYFHSAVSSYSGVLCSLHLRQYRRVVEVKMWESRVCLEWDLMWGGALRLCSALWQGDSFTSSICTKLHLPGINKLIKKHPQLTQNLKSLFFPHFLGAMPLPF